MLKQTKFTSFCMAGFLFLLIMRNETVFSQYRLPLQFENRFVINNLNSSVDGMDMDVKTNRMFLTSTKTNTLYSVDMSNGSILQIIKNLNKPKGVLYLTGLNCLFVVNSGDGLCHMLKANNLEHLFSVILAKDADQIRFDAVSRKIFVGNGNGAISIIDGSNGKIIGNHKLSSHPEGFEIDFKRNLIFANVPKKNSIEVIDYVKSKTVYTWKLKGKSDNIPMAYDIASSRLFICSQSPSEFLMLGAYTGRIMATLECAKEPENMSFDPFLKRIYVASGEGFIHVFQQKGDNYESLAKKPTKKGAITFLHVPILNRVYIIIPGDDDHPAEIYIYKLQV